MRKTILVCGLGSMGKRRMGILSTRYPEFDLVGVDTRDDRCLEAEGKFNISTRQDYDSALEDIHPFAVFVCTSPKHHPGIIVRALEHGAHTFSEINLSAEGYETIMDAADRNNRVAFLSSTFLYREEILWMIKRLDSVQPVSYRYHVGQYLPDWHPWENYKDFFVGEKQGSACREIMAIEFPWLIRTFGPVRDSKVVKTTLSGLDLDYEDTFHLLFVHENGNVGTLSIDCICAKAVRKLEVFSDTFYLEWEGTPDSLALFSREENKMEKISLYKAVEKKVGYEEFVIENPYVEEVAAFFKAAADPKKAGQWYGYRQDRDIMHLIEAVDHGIKIKDEV